MAITKADAATLLALMSTYDGRASSNEAIDAWREILFDVSYEEAMSAVLAWYRKNHGFMQPADVVEEIRLAKLEQQRAAARVVERKKWVLIREKMWGVYGEVGSPSDPDPTTRSTDAEWVARIESKHPALTTSTLTA